MHIGGVPSVIPPSYTVGACVDVVLAYTVFKAAQCLPGSNPKTTAPSINTPSEQIQ